MGDSSWTQVEFSVARALALQVRLMTCDQVARGWFGNNATARELAAHTLDRLQRCELVEQRVLEAHPLIPQSRPLLAWKTGEEPPGDSQFLELAETSRIRWRLPHAPVEVYRATKRACRAFGAFVDAQDARNCETTHDLHLTEVFVLYRMRKPRQADQWLGEGAFPKLGFDIRGMKDPDAFLVDAEGNGLRVIEFAGTYEAEHLRAIHYHCAGNAAQKLTRQQQSGTSSVLNRLYPAKGIGYELW